MKKSNVLLFLIVVNIIVFYIDTSLLRDLISRIQITILAVGYFIVKQLEENQNVKK